MVEMGEGGIRKVSDKNKVINGRKFEPESGIAGKISGQTPNISG